MALEYLKHLARLDARDIHPGGSAASAALLQALNLEPGQRVLEFGCGAASTLERVCRRYQVSAVGLDLLPEMLSRARRRLEAAGVADRVTLVRGSAGSIPFARNTFDAVYCESVLGFQKTAELTAILHEIFRVLRPGGQLIANEGIWKPGVDPDLVRSINSACEKDFGLPQSTESAWDVDGWLHELRTVGFEVDSYELLEDLAANGTTSNDPMAAVGASSSLSRRLRRTAMWLRPDLIADRLRYRRLISAYRPVSIYTEGRLFVASRPVAEN